MQGGPGSIPHAMTKSLHAETKIEDLSAETKTWESQINTFCFSKTRPGKFLHATTRPDTSQLAETGFTESMKVA